MGTQRYTKPSTGTHLLNAVLAVLARLGVSVYGSRILAVRGRTRSTYLTIEGAQYIVAPRGETQWVRNLRACRVRSSCSGDLAGILERAIRRVTAR